MVRRARPPSSSSSSSSSSFRRFVDSMPIHLIRARRRTLIAALAPVLSCTASFTHPNAPLPSVCLSAYAPTRVTSRGMASRVRVAHHGDARRDDGRARAGRAARARCASRRRAARDGRRRAARGAAKSAREVAHRRGRGRVLGRARGASTARESATRGLTRRTIGFDANSARRAR